MYPVYKYCFFIRWPVMGSEKKRWTFWEI